MLKGLAEAHHGALLDAVARLDDRVVLGRPTQEVGQLAVRAVHGLAFRSLCPVAAFMLEKVEDDWVSLCKKK